MATTPEAISPVRRLWQLLKPERGDIGIVYFYAALTGLFSLATPLGVQAIVQLVSGGLILQPVVILIAFVIIATIVAGILQLLQLHVVEVLQRRIFARLAFDFTYRIPRLRLESIQNQDLPELMNRFFEVLSIQKALSKLLTETTTAMLQVVFGLILLTFYHPYFLVLSLVLAGGLYLVFRLTAARGLQTSLQESKYKYRVAYWLEEMARTVRTFKYAASSTLAITRMDDDIASYLGYRRKHFSVLVQQSVSILIFKVLITGGLLIVGSMLVIDNRISLGQFVASELVIVLVLGALEKVILSLETVYDILTAVDKAGMVSDLPLEMSGGMAPTVVSASSKGMEVTARNAGYRYPDSPNPALGGLTLDIASGSRVAVSGFDGAGQTTLLKLLGALYESPQGAIAFDGLGLQDLDRSLLRERIGLVLETNELFPGTLEENVSVGRPGVTTAVVLQALERVGLREFVLTLPGGLQTEVHVRGLELPITVARKLQVARAIAGSPSLLLVDDIIQHFDTISRRQMVRLLTDPDAPWTLVCATHDPLLMASCDRVIVLDQGRIYADGPYESLIADTLVRNIVLSSPEISGSAA